MFLETMYRRHEQSFVYLSPGKNQELLDLQFQLSELITRKFTILQPHRFFPHLTLGKIEKADPITTKTWLAKINEFEYDPLEEFLVKQVRVYESSSSRSGVYYQRVADFGLATP